MWQFAVGLYLVELTPGSLRLTAIYQLVKTVAVILFGPFVGDWVDASPRLRGTGTICTLITAMSWGIIDDDIQNTNCSHTPHLHPLTCTDPYTHMDYCVERIGDRDRGPSHPT